jgi:hypothetical protein
MLREQTEHTHKVSAFTQAEIFQLAKGKAALSKMTTAALALLADRPETVPDLSASQDCFNAARQLYDDVKDWKDDYLHGRYSSLLTAALLAMSSEGAHDPRGGIDPDDVSAELHRGGHVASALNQAARWCDDSLQHVAGYQMAGWTRLVTSLRSQVVRLRDDLAEIQSRTEGVIEPKPGASGRSIQLETESV